jgi:hypothetical protein
MDTIQTMLPEVSRKTLFNWRKQDNWEELRRARVVKSSTRRERLEASLDRALDELEVVFDPKLVFAVGKIIAALKSSSTFEFTEERKAKDNRKEREMSEDTWKEIEERFGL